jgi:DNA-directed RNA polymerase subunit K/omega
MTDIKTKVQGLDPNLHARDVKAFVKDTGNIYESLAVIAKRAKQLSVDLKRELHDKLDEFAVNPETIEEVTENKEQIEISKFYERLPNPAVIATEEYLHDGLHARYTDNKRNKY